MFLREILLVALVCSLTYSHSTRRKEVIDLEQAIEELVRFVNDEAHKSHLENQELRKRQMRSTKSGRMMQQMKWISPELRTKEEAAVKSLHATKNLMELTGLSLREIQDSKEIMSEWKKQTTACPTNQINCSDASNTFRSANGLCNNLVHPGYGSAGSAQSRFLPPEYGDGVGSPRTLGKNGQLLPSPREISNKVFKSEKEKIESDVSLMVMAWGQFLDHDITLTPASSGSEGAVTDCCNSTSELPECFPITIPSNDAHFTNTDCMEFVRSAAITDTCSPNHREQFNAITAFIDGSNVYGSSINQMNGLRSFNNGLLKTSTNTASLPPAGDPHTCLVNSTEEFCIKTGDVRANVVPHLGANHVLFFREHNRIATVLSSMNANWDDERTFQETRKIISGILQQITYYEWLPSILSPSDLSKYKLESSNNDEYKPKVDPNIRNGFAVAAMRFGHSMVPPLEGYLLHDYATWEVKKPIQETFFRPSMVIGNEGQDVPKLARWLCHNNSMRTDRIFEPGVRDMLFLDNDGRSFDLAALNIQRGRDHGIPPYNAYRKKFGLNRLNNFNNMPDHNNGARGALKDVYSHVNDIDLYAGAMSEKKTSDGLLGPTFSAMLAKQFKKLKFGDRFWFERPSPEGFSQNKRDEIRKMTLAKVMCTNFGMDQITEDVFHVQSNKNQLTTCSSIPEMDLTEWME